jgi:hypothetical protein
MATIFLKAAFLGLDNIGVFNRSHHFVNEMQLEQADGTSWMGMYALNMMDMALEISRMILHLKILPPNFLNILC